MELIGQGKTPEQAMKESAPIFWHNMGVLMATNTVSYFLPLPIKVKNEFVRRAAKAVEAAFTEGGQERAQAVIQDVASGRGEWGDFLDPNKNVTDTLVGALVGGGTAALLPGEPDAPQNVPVAPLSNAPVQPSQPSATPPTPQQAPAQAAQPAKPAPPSAAPAAPIPVPSDLPMQPVEGFDVWTGQQEDEDAAPLAQTPAQQETPAPVEAAPPAPAREIVNHFINESDGTVSEVIGEPDGTFSVDTTDSESGNRIELRKRFPTQDAAEVHAKLMTGQQEQEAAPQDAPIQNDVQLTSRNRLATPIKGKTGASIVGYQWMSTTEEGMFRDRKVSDWTRSQKSEPTGRDIVHVFFVQTEDGSVKVMGVGAAQKALGISTDRLYSIAKSEQQMARQRIENRDKEEARILEKVASESPVEAARKWRTSNGAKGDITKTVLMTKGGKFFRTADANLQESLSERGWSVAEGDPVDELREQEAAASPAAEPIPAPAPADIAPQAAAQESAPPPAAVAETAGAPAAAAGIVSMPTSALTVSKPGEFQTRENIDNEETQTNEAKMTAIMADFKPDRLTPIVAWRDPVDGKLKILDGHHTLEAAKRAGIPNVNVREFVGTREEAKTEADILNDLRTVNDPLSRAATVRRLRESGMSEAEIEATSRPRYQEGTPTVIQLSFLSPNGQVVASIKQLMGSDQDSDSTSDLMKMAKWIGEARRRNTNLTDAHEQEMFDALRANFGKTPWAKNAQAFTKHVRGLATAGGFDASSRLNLGLDKRTPAEKKFDTEVAAAEAAVAEAEATLKEKSAQLAAAGIDVNVKDKILKPFREAVDIAEADLAVLNGSRERYLEAERNQGGLFRLSSPSISKLNAAASKRGLTPAEMAKPRDLMDEMVVRVAKMFGFKNVQFVTGLAAPNGQMAHGYYQQESDTVFLNAGSSEPMLTVLMHEVGHRMEVEHPDLYGQLIQILNDPANVRTGAKEIYGKDAKARGYTEAGVEREWVSDGLMEASSRPEFWNVLQEKNPTLAGKLVNMIVDAIKAIRKMFAASGASVDVYYNNFGPLVRQIANVAAQMQAREAELARSEKTAKDAIKKQPSMFRVAPALRKIATWFSGTGTLEAVLSNAKGVHAVEYSPEIIAQHNKAYGTSYTARDVTEIDPLEVAGTGADHFHASPVCKNFSKAKRNRGSSNLDIASARAVVGVILKAGMPSITIENVTDYIGTEPYKMIVEALKKAGYTQRTVKVNAADYGGAQNRTRMVIQAVKDGNLPPLPDKTGPTDWFAAIEDLLADAPKSTVAEERVKGRGWNWEPDRIAKMVERGELDADLPIIAMGGSTDKVRAWAANSGGPAPTLKATKGETVRIIMPDGTVYKATPRMLARLMGMPDSFQIPENYGFAKKVLGNGIHGAITKAFIEPLVNGERGTSPVSEDTAGQIEMFRIAPIANPVANEMRDKQDVAMKANNQHRHQGWRAGWRHVYMNMVDKHTFTYRMVRDIVKAANPKLAKDFSLAKSPYIALRRFGSWMTAVEVALKYGVYSFDGQTVLAPGMEQIIKKHGLSDAIDSREFGLFYTAATLVSRKYSLDSRGKDFFGDDPTTDEYQAAEDEFLKWQKIYDDYKKAHPTWEAAVDDFTAYAYALIQRSYEAGVINEREFKDLTKTYSVYAPLFVIESSRYDVDRGDPVAAGSVAHEMTRFDPTAVRMDPIDALIKQTYHMEFFTRRNTAAQQHANFIKKYRDKSKKGVTVLEGFGMRVRPKEDPVAKRVQQLLEAAGLSEAEIAALGRTPEQLEREAKLYVTSRMQPDGVIALLRDGEVEYWQLDPDIYESFMAATGPKAMHPMMKFFSAQTSLLRAGAVLTPDFMARNQFRDFASSAIISQHLIRNPIDPFLVPVKILRGLSAAINQTEAFKEFMLEVGHSQLHAQDQNGLRKSSEQLTRDSRGRFKYVLHSSPITILQEFGKLTENSTRYAVYWKTKTDLLKMGWSESEARVKAAMEARESSIDFARSGKYGQVINQIIPFFNAAVQGNDKALRTFVVDSGGRGSAWLKATMLITVPSVLLWALNHDDEWYKDQPIWLKNNFWLFSVDGGKTIHKLPKPFELGLMYASLAERFLDWRVDKDPKAMKEWSEAVLKNVVAVNDKNPIASVGGLLGPMAGTMTEIVSNYDSFRGTPIVKGWLEEVVPREQYNANTSEFAKAMGGMAPGGGISPMMIDHFIRGTFGGLGAYGAQVASEIIMLARPELKAMKPSPKQIHTLVGADVPDWIPVIRAFASSTPSGYTRQMNDFFEIYDRGREASKTIQAFKASGAPVEKFKAEYRRSGAEIATFKASQEVAEKLGQISKRARFIESLPSTEMTRDEKRKQIDQLTETRNLMVKKFLERYYAIDQRDLQRQIDESLKQIGR
jgi:site-specific DNA-cytosine methylase